MKKMHLKGFSEVLTESEKKKVMGGNPVSLQLNDNEDAGTIEDGFDAGGGTGGGNLPPCGNTPEKQYCKDKKTGDTCYAQGRQGKCKPFPGMPTCLLCNLGGL